MTIIKSHLIQRDFVTVSVLDKRYAFAILAGIVALLLSPPVLADSSWTADGFTSNWTNPLNWFGGVPSKSATENVLFGNLSSNFTSTLNEHWTLGGLEISFTSGSNEWIASNGAVLTIHHGIRMSAPPAVIDRSPDIRFPIKLGANAGLETTAGSARIEFYKNINTNGKFLALKPNGGAIHIRNTITGSGGLIKQGTKAAILYGKNTYSGSTTIEQGTLRLFDDGFLPDQSFVTINSGATLRIDPVNSGGRTDAIAGLNGAGNVDLRGGSRLYMGNTINNSPGIGSFSGSIFGSGGIGKRGGGTQTLSGALNFNSNILVQQGKLIIGSGATVQQTPNVSVSSGATFQIDGTSHFGTLSGAGSVLINGNAQVDNLTGTSTISVAASKNLTAAGDFSGAISGPGGLNAGTLTLRNKHTYTGVTTVNALGFLSVLGGGRLSDQSVVDLKTSAILSLGSGITDAISGLDGDGTVTLNSSSSLVIGNFAGFNSIGDGDFSGLINGPGSLQKRGSSGTQILRGGSSYTGGTVIQEGILELRSSSAPTPASPSMLGTGNVSIKTGGALAGIGSTGPGLVTVTDGLLRPGIDGGGKLLMDRLSMSDVSALYIDLGGTGEGEYDVLEAMNTATIGGSLEVDLYDGFKFGLGDTFDVVMAESILGMFDTLTLPGSNGLTLEVQYLTDAIGTTDVVRLTAVPAPSTLPVLVLMWISVVRCRKPGLRSI